MKEQNGFQKLYVWSMNAKMYMSLYFMVLVMCVGGSAALTGADSVGIWTLVQILAVSLVIGMLQAALLPDDTDYTRGLLFGRAIVWVLAATALTLGAALLWRWLGALGFGWYALLAVLMLGGSIAMLVGQKWEQERDTLRLDRDLKRFQAK